MGLFLGGLLGLSANTANKRIAGKENTIKRKKDRSCIINKDLKDGTGSAALAGGGLQTGN